MLPRIACNPMSRADVIRETFRRYHAREITLAQLLAVLAQWRQRR